MADNKKAKKADKRRAALKQHYEREYMVRELDSAAGYLGEALRLVRAQATRLRAGYPGRKARCS